MRSFAVLSAAGLAAAQVTSIVITDGITATLTLPVFPDPTASETVTATVPETTVTVAPEPETPTPVSPSTTVTVSVGTSTVLSGLTTTTVIVAPPVPMPTLTGTEDATITLDPITTITEATPVIPPTVNSEAAFYISQSYGPKEKPYANMLVKKATLATSTATVTVSPNATTSGPVTVPTAAADRVALKSSVAGLIAFGVASLFLF